MGGKKIRVCWNEEGGEVSQKSTHKSLALSSRHENKEKESESKSTKSSKSKRSWEIASKMMFTLSQSIPVFFILRSKGEIFFVSVEVW